MFKFKEFIAEARRGAVGRVRIINARVRGGKLQRRKYVSNVKNYRLDRNRHLVRITTTERLHRKLGALKAKRKRRAEMARSIRRRKMSLTRKHSFGY
jgi:hypothetical protein